MSDPQNKEISYALGRIEALLEVQGEATQRVEASLGSLSTKFDARVSKLEDRVTALEKDAAKTGVWSGIVSSTGVAIIIEVIRRWK